MLLLQAQQQQPTLRTTTTAAPLHSRPAARDSAAAGGASGRPSLDAAASVGSSVSDTGLQDAHGSEGGSRNRSATLGLTPPSSRDCSSRLLPQTLALPAGRQEQQQQQQHAAPFQLATRMCRAGGASSLYHPVWHYERVAIKIPSLEPSDLQPGFAERLTQALERMPMGQGSRVLMTAGVYVRRGCVRLVLDLAWAPAAAAAGEGCSGGRDGCPGHCEGMLLQRWRSMVQDLPLPWPDGVHFVTLQAGTCSTTLRVVTQRGSVLSVEAASEAACASAAAPAAAATPVAPAAHADTIRQLQEGQQGQGQGLGMGQAGPPSILSVSPWIALLGEPEVDDDTRDGCRRVLPFNVVVAAPVSAPREALRLYARHAGRCLAATCQRLASPPASEEWGDEDAGGDGGGGRQAPGGSGSGALTHSRLLAQLLAAAAAPDSNQQAQRQQQRRRHAFRLQVQAASLGPGLLHIEACVGEAGQLSRVWPVLLLDDAAICMEVSELRRDLAPWDGVDDDGGHGHAPDPSGGVGAAQVRWCQASRRGMPHEGLAASMARRVCVQCVACVRHHVICKRDAGGTA